MEHGRLRPGVARSGQARAESKAYQASASNHHGGPAPRAATAPDRPWLPATPPVAPEPSQNVGGTGTGGVQLRPETGDSPPRTTRQGGAPRMGPAPGPNLALPQTPENSFWPSERRIPGNEGHRDRVPYTARRGIHPKRDTICISHPVLTIGNRTMRLM